MTIPKQGYRMLAYPGKLAAVKRVVPTAKAHNVSSSEEREVPNSKNHLLQDASIILQREFHVQESTLSDPSLVCNAVCQCKPTPLYLPGGDKEHIRLLRNPRALHILLNQGASGDRLCDLLKRHLCGKGLRPKDKASVAALCTLDYANISPSTRTLDENCLRFLDLKEIAPSQIEQLPGGRCAWQEEYFVLTGRRSDRLLVKGASNRQKMNPSPIQAELIDVAPNDGDVVIAALRNESGSLVLCHAKRVGNSAAGFDAERFWSAVADRVGAETT